MKPHTRIRKTIKWGGLVATVLLVIVAGASIWCGVSWQSGTADHVFLSAGSVVSFHISGLPQVSGSRWSFRMQPPRFVWMPTIDTNASIKMTVVVVPLWIPLVVAAGIAALAWRLDTLASRRARLDLCHICHYDRTGLALGAVCPECGRLPP